MTYHDSTGKTVPHHDSSPLRDSAADIFCSPRYLHPRQNADPSANGPFGPPVPAGKRDLVIPFATSIITFSLHYTVLS